jgi:hypothetical protein
MHLCNYSINKYHSDYIKWVLLLLTQVLDCNHTQILNNFLHDHVLFLFFCYISLFSSRNGQNVSLDWLDLVESVQRCESVHLLWSSHFEISSLSVSKLDLWHSESWLKRKGGSHDLWAEAWVYRVVEL